MTMPTSDFSNMSTFALMKWIDTHSHLYLQQFDDDRDEMMKRCKENGVDHIFLPDIDASTTDSLWKLVDQYPNTCFGMSGLHPCSVNENYREQLEHVSKIAREKPIVAIGEIGLDYYWDKTYVEQQKLAYRAQIEMALELDLPIIIHSRDSLDDTIGMVEDFADPRLKGVFHCFNGDVKQMERIQKLGFFMGLGGVITFKNSKMEDVLSEIDMNLVILETDSPYLTPTPFRGKRNESSYIPLIGEKLAEVRNLKIDEVAQITTRNAKLLYKLD